ncbi:type II toxin-antitoxin system VapC family toxin [Ochrobactrum tritici]|uniref:Type II toxin-antitoxin system VapC family toxin n=1 Tax=Brucella tritici TaxID=94626 RepID=A0A7X6FPL9_9HYPH|nr:type II toxin-antitoxin system VapC family toxin [Brucella tritici]
MTLVDTNVLLDLATDDPQWAEWSIGQLETASLTGPLLINEVIYAELAVRYERIEDLDHFIEAAGLQMASLPREALFWQAKSLPNIEEQGLANWCSARFFIGAHAAVQQIPLLTRDVGRYRTYFPTVALITPNLL